MKTRFVILNIIWMLALTFLIAYGLDRLNWMFG